MFFFKEVGLKIRPLCDCNKVPIAVHKEENNQVLSLDVFRCHNQLCIFLVNPNETSLLKDRMKDIFSLTFKIL